MIHTSWPPQQTGPTSSLLHTRYYASLHHLWTKYNFSCDANTLKPVKHSTFFQLRTTESDSEQLICIIDDSHFGCNPYQSKLMVMVGRLQPNHIVCKIKFKKQKFPNMTPFLTWLRLDVMSMSTTSRIRDKGQPSQRWTCTKNQLDFMSACRQNFTFPIHGL